MKNEISILGPEEIGKAVRTALKSSHKDGIALILINSRHECSHSDGGCRIVARALKQIIPDGRIVTMVSRSVHLGSIWSPTHYGFRLPGDTGVIDGRGRASSARAWIRRFKTAELLIGREFKVVEKEMPGTAPKDTKLVNKLAAALGLFLTSTPDAAIKGP